MQSQSTTIVSPFPPMEDGPTAVDDPVYRGSLRRHQLLLTGAVMLLAFVLYLVVADRHTEFFTTMVYKGPLGGDTYNGAEAFAKLKYEWRHPLMSPLTAGATAMFGLVPELPHELALSCAVALLAALNVAFACLVLLRLTGTATIAVPGSLLYALLFANLNGLAITDSYAVSSLTIWLFLLIWLAPGPDVPARSWRMALAGGVAGLANVPLLSLAGLPVARALLHGKPVAAARLAVVVAGGALLLTAAVVLTHSQLKWGSITEYFARSAGYTAEYGDAGRLVEIGSLLDVLSAFLLLAVATPVVAVPGALGREAVTLYLAGPTGWIGIGLVAALLACAAASLIGRWWRIALPVAAWIMALVLFYAFFNPADSMLYSIQAQAALALLVILGIMTMVEGQWTRCGSILALALTLGAHNLPVVRSAPYAIEPWYAEEPRGTVAAPPWVQLPRSAVPADAEPD